MLTSKFSAVMLLEALDTWLERKQSQSLRSSPYFSILADECQDISTHEELSICCRWIVDGYPEEHFLDILHIEDVDAASITQALTSFMEQRNLDYRRLVGQGYDGAATFCGCRNGVQRRIRTHSVNAVYIHCACHRLQLASIQAAESVTSINNMFGMMTNMWKLFYYSPKKAEALKVVQSVLNLPELKVVKPSSTRWLSHERCLRAIRRDLPALIITLQQLYQTSGDAEPYGISLVFSSFSGVASIILLSEVLDLLARFSCYMQRQTADFSRLPMILESILKELKQLKEDKAEWCSEVSTQVDKLESDHEITRGRSARSCVGDVSVGPLTDFRDKVALPYIDALLHNIHNRFSGEAVNLLVSSSVFNPASLPLEETALPDYGILAQFYGSEATVVMVLLSLLHHLLTRMKFLLSGAYSSEH